jgi:predicted dehydrogenase
MPNTINVGLVGYKFMGKAHSNAYRQVASFFPDVALRPVMKALCGRDAAAVQEQLTSLAGRSRHRWRELVARDDIGLVDVSTPGDSHAPIAIAAAENGNMCFVKNPWRIRWPKPNKCRQQSRRQASSVWSTSTTAAFPLYNSPSS